MMIRALLQHAIDSHIQGKFTFYFPDWPQFQPLQKTTHKYTTITHKAGTMPYYDALNNRLITPSYDICELILELSSP